MARCNWLVCRVCQEKFRTRLQRVLDAKLCPKCIFKRAVSEEITQRLVEAPAAIQKAIGYEVSWDRMPERWFQELLFRQCEMDGLTGLGYGKLNFLHPNQKILSRMGKWIEGNMEFDFLLKCYESGCHVAIELKKEADEFSIGQCLKYVGFLGSHKMVKSHKMALVTVRLTPEFERTIRAAWANGLSLDLFTLSVEDGRFLIRKVEK